MTHSCSHTALSNSTFLTGPRAMTSCAPRLIATCVALALVSMGVSADNAPVTFPATSLSVLRQGAVVPKQVTGFSVTEVGKWLRDPSLAKFLTIFLPVDVDLYGAEMQGTLAISEIATAATNVSNLMTTGTSYDLCMNAGDPSAIAFVWVGLGSNITCTSPHALNQEYALFGVSGSATSVWTAGTTATNLTFTSLKVSGGSLAGFFTGGAPTAAINRLSASQYLEPARFANGNLLVNETAKIGTITKTTSGIQIVLSVNDDAVNISGDSTFQLPSLALAARSGAATTNNLVLSFADGNATGVSPVNIGLRAMTVGSIVTGLSTLSVTGAVPSVPVGNVAPQQLAAFVVTVQDQASTGNIQSLQFTLTNGQWRVGSEAAIYAALTGNIKNRINSASQLTLDSARRVLTIALDSNETFSSGDTLVIGNGVNALDTSGSQSGPITVASTASGGLGDWGGGTVTIANAVTAATTVSFRDDATAGPGTLFVGRTTQRPGATEGVLLTESVFGALVSGGTVSLAVDSGARYTTGLTLATAETGGLVLPDTSATGAGATLTNTFVSTPSSSTAGTVTVTGFSFDLSNATEGNLNVAVSGSAGATGTVKLASLLFATSAGISGNLASLAPNQNSVALPSITLSEKAVGAIVPNRGICLTLPAGVAYDTNVNPTLTVTTVTGEGVLSTVARSGTSANGYGSLDGNSGRSFMLALTPSAFAANTPLRITASGFRVNSTNPTPGDVLMTVTNCDNSGSNAITTATSDSQDGTTPGSGALVTKQTVSVGRAVSATTLDAQAIITGPITSRSIKVNLQAAGNDQGKLGTLYVVAVLPAEFNNGIFSNQGADSWVSWNGSSPFAHFITDVTLGAHTLDVVKGTYDLSALRGTKLYVGYGVGSANLNARAAHDNMLNNGTYKLVYTLE